MKLLRLKSRLQIVCRLAAVGLLFGLVVTSCSDDETTADVNSQFNPKQPVTITSFIPESGGAQEQIVIKGSNFGSDKSRIKLTIGGIEAVIVSVKNDMIYAYVPARAFSGEIAITITGDNETTYSAVADKVFNYEAQTVVGTLCGYRNDNDTQGEKWGSFDICSGFRSEGTLIMDPIYPDRAYVCYDGSNKVGMLDLAKRESSLCMSSSKFQNQRLRNMDFTTDGQFMLVSTDRAENGTHSTSVWIVQRNADGSFSDDSPCEPLVAYKQCNGVAVHPVNGEVYFNSYSDGQLFRCEIADYFNAKNNGIKWTGYLEDGAYRELFKIKEQSYEFATYIHPSGNYAYILVINHAYILRTDYNWEKKEFTTPYGVAGLNNTRGWVDAVGTSSRMQRPYQGVFVKNPKYEAEGKDDVYDFYFCDTGNFCIRSMTPEGIVRTYAGHSPSTDGNIWGTENGALRTAARFRDVTGITYDEKRDVMYILDHNNRSIRTIGKENAGTATNDASSEEETTTEE